MSGRDLIEQASERWPYMECQPDAVLLRDLAAHADHLETALREIADFPIIKNLSAGYHFAQVRRIVAVALADADAQ